MRDETQTQGDAMRDEARSQDVIKLLEWDDLDWSDVEVVAEYVETCGGDDEPIPCVVWLQSAESEDGRTWYRWYANDDEDHGDPMYGDPTPDAEQARAEGEQYARERDETPDLRELCGAILRTRYFAPQTTLNDLCEFCKDAAKYDEGYFLLPRSWRPRYATDAWQAGGSGAYMTRPHVRLEPRDASGRPELFARALLREIRGFLAEQND